MTMYVYRRFLIVTFFVLGLTMPYIPTEASPRKPKKECETALDSLVKVGTTAPFGYKGYTKSGVERVIALRDALRHNRNLHHSRIMFMEDAYKAGVMARALHAHALYWGGPGGAKSMNVDFFFRSEPSNDDRPGSRFKYQVNAMDDQTPFVGGRKFDDANDGRWVINPDGSLSQHRFAIVDEAETGNPLSLAALLGIMAPEREVMAGPVVIPAQTESVFMTSNSSLGEIEEIFRENGDPKKAQALLNRMLFSVFTNNWLPQESQRRIDEYRRKRNYLESLLAMGVPEATRNAILQDEVFIEPMAPDYRLIWHLANTLFQPTDNFKIKSTEFTEVYRREVRKMIFESQQARMSGSQQGLTEYLPNFDPSERARQPMEDVVRVSLVLDFLMSPLADDESLAALLTSGRQLEYGPLSLWRSAYTFTTLSSGEMNLVFNTANPSDPFDVRFGEEFDVADARDPRERTLYEQGNKEREIWERLLVDELRRERGLIDEAAQILSQIEGSERRALELLGNKDSPIELALLAANGQIVNEAIPTAPSSNDEDSDSSEDDGN